MWDEADREAGRAEVFLGLHKPRLVANIMDERFLLATAIVALIGALSGTRAYSLVIIGLAVLIAFAGIVLGRVSPYILEEINEYLRLRMHAGDFVLVDDAGSDAPGVNAWRK